MVPAVGFAKTRNFEIHSIFFGRPWQALHSEIKWRAEGQHAGLPITIPKPGTTGHGFTGDLSIGVAFYLLPGVNSSRWSLMHVCCLQPSSLLETSPYCTTARGYAGQLVLGKMSLSERTEAGLGGSSLQERNESGSRAEQQSLRIKEGCKRSSRQESGGLSVSISVPRSLGETTPHPNSKTDNAL